MTPSFYCIFLMFISWMLIMPSFKKSLIVEKFQGNYLKRFFDGLKTVYGPSSNAMVPVPSSDGTLLTERSDIVQRRCKIFNHATSQQTISDRPVSHPRHASAPGSKALLTIPQHRRKPRKMLSNCRLGKHRFLMGYLVKSLRREERSSQSSSLSWCSSFGTRA